ncbi:hypothetical protein PMIN07_012442 [Paraphaeosphaeria minitans]
MPSYDIYDVGDASNQSINVFNEVSLRPTRRPLTILRPPPAVEEEGVRLFSISPPRGNDDEFDFSAFSGPELWPWSPATRDVSEEAEEPRVTSRQLTPAVSKVKERPLHLRGSRHAGKTNVPNNPLVEGSVPIARADAEDQGEGDNGAISPIHTAAAAAAAEVVEEEEEGEGEEEVKEEEGGEEGEEEEDASLQTCSPIRAETRAGLSLRKR